MLEIVKKLLSDVVCGGKESTSVKEMALWTGIVALALVLELKSRDHLGRLLYYGSCIPATFLVAMIGQVNSIWIRFWILVRLVSVTALEGWPGKAILVWYMWLSVIMIILVATCEQTIIVD